MPTQLLLDLNKNMTEDVTSTKASYKSSSDKSFANSSDFENALNSANKQYKDHNIKDNNNSYNNKTSPAQNQPQAQSKSADSTQKTDDKVSGNEDKNTTIENSETDVKEPDNDSDSQETTLNETSDNNKTQTVNSTESADNYSQNQGETKDDVSQNLLNIISLGNAQQASSTAPTAATTDTTANNVQTSTTQTTPSPIEKLLANIEPVQQATETTPQSSTKVSANTIIDATKATQDTQSSTTPAEKTIAETQQPSIDILTQQIQTLVVSNTVAQDTNNAADDTTNTQNTPVQNVQATPQINDNSRKVLPSVGDNQQAVMPENTNILTQSTPTTSTLIEAASDTVAQSTNTNATTGNKDATQSNNTTISQDVVDKTNAKVLSVETTYSSNLKNENNNNFAKHQDAQEQVVKFGIENASSTPATASPSSTGTMQNADITATQFSLNSSSQSNFSSTTQQTQAQTAFTQNSDAMNPSDIIAQMNKQLSGKNIGVEASTKVNMVLNPENLGKISLELISSKDGLVAQMTATNAQVKEMLNNNIDNLKESLNQQGIHVNSVTVKVEETQSKSNDMFSSQNQTGKEGQQNSQQNASKNSNQENSFENKFSSTFNGELTEDTETIETETPSIKVESSTTINSRFGQISYKV